MFFVGWARGVTVEEQATPAAKRYVRAERRIARLTLMIGVPTALVLAGTVSLRWGVGVLVGTLLAWLNFRWLQEALDSLVRFAKGQAGGRRPKVTIWSHLKMFLRYAVIGIVLYTLWAWMRIPVVSMLTGLCALGAATFMESVYELFDRAS